MEDKDKIIIVIYGGLKGRQDSVLEFLTAIDRMVKTGFDDSVKTLVIPRYDTEETWIECINPQLVTEEKYKEAEEAVEKLKKMLEEIK